MPMHVVELCHTWLYAGCDCSMYFVTTSASACTYMHMYVHAQHLMIGFKLKSIIKAKQFSSSVFLLEHFFHFYRRTELLLSSLIGLSPVTPDDASHLTATLRYVSRLTPASVARVQLLSCIHTAYYNGKAGKRWGYVYAASLESEVQADWMVQSMVLLFFQLHLITTLINHYTLNTVFSQVTGTCRVWSLTCCACTASHVQGMPLWTSWSPNFSLDPQWGPACSGQQQYPQMFHTTKCIVMLYNLLFVTTVFAQSDAALD